MKPMTISKTSSIRVIVALAIFTLVVVAACTPEGEVDLQQFAEAVETAEAVSVALEQATIRLKS